MPAPLMVGMTTDVLLEGPYVLRLVALDAATGNQVANVSVSQGVLLAEDQSTTDETPAPTEPDLVFVPE